MATMILSLFHSAQAAPSALILRGDSELVFTNVTDAIQVVGPHILAHSL